MLCSTAHAFLEYQLTATLYWFNCLILIQRCHFITILPCLFCQGLALQLRFCMRAIFRKYLLQSKAIKLWWKKEVST